MPLEVPLEDLRRDFVGCVVMYQNKPVYVIAVARDGTVSYRELKSQKDGEAPFTLADFGKPVPRVGFVNVNHSVIYVTRDPVRKYYMGINRGNIQAKAILGIGYPLNAAETKQRVQSLCIPELGDAIMNKYPSLEAAAKQVKKFGGACAFDKQFAISAEEYIFYKGERVGSCSLNAKGSADINWNENKKHLSILLDGNHEKTVRDFRPA